MFIEIKMLQALMIKCVIFLRSNIPKDETSYMLPVLKELSMQFFCIIAVRNIFYFCFFRSKKITNLCPGTTSRTRPWKNK